MEKSGFFNSVNGDRLYDASDFARYFGALASNGVFYHSADNLKVLPGGTGVSVIVSPGSGWINGYSYENDAEMSFQLSTPNGVTPRIDRIVLRLDMTLRRIFLAVKAGVAQANPEPPALTRTADVYELALADVFVSHAAVAIVVADITDRRLDQSLCGLVNSLVSAVYE